MAGSHMSAAELPHGVQLEQRKLSGKRMVTRGKRIYGNTRVFSAEYPEDGLIETENPKLVCVISGQTDYQLGEYLLNCSAGYFILVPPLIPHPDGKHSHLEGIRKENGFCEILQVIPYRRGIQCMVCQSRGPHHEHVPGGNVLIRNDQAHQLLYLMFAEATCPQENHTLMCAHLLTTFMLLLQREINAGHYLLPGPMPAHEVPVPPPNDFVMELKQYVLAHLGEQLTLDNVARHMHLSRSQFAVRVREQTGQTFIEYLTAYRLREAQVLLRESEWTTMTISEFVGFKSSTYFHRLFREKTGMSPGEYRRRSRTEPGENKKHTKGKPVRR